MKSKFHIIFLAICLALPFNVFAGPVVDTGQTGCYDATGEISCGEPGSPFYGQDATYLIHPPSYTKMDVDGNELTDDATEWVMVQDNVTGLIWEVKQNQDNQINHDNPHDADNQYTWYDSHLEGIGAGNPGDGTDTQDFIYALNAQNFGGFSDWRIPKRDELRTIVHYDRINPAIDTAYFPNSVPSDYWSATSVAGDMSNAWYINFNLGNDFPADKGYNGYVRAVRGERKQTTGHLIINDDGTVTDTGTGLMWQQSTDMEMNWSNALEHCENFSLGGYTDWRLPNLKELSAILDLSRRNPAIDGKAFPDTLPANYWSSTTFFKNPEYAWNMNFETGYDNYNEKSYNRYVRAVRGGQPRLSEGIFITAPAQASRWYVDEQKTITWEAREIAGNVRISLSREAGRPETFETIAETTENSGSFPWTVTGPESLNCALRIEPVDGPAFGSTQSLFAICELKNAWITAEPIETPDRYRLRLNGKCTDGILPIETAWTASDPAVAEVDGDLLTGLQSGWVQVFASHIEKTYVQDVFVYTGDGIMESEPNDTAGEAFGISEGAFYEAKLLAETDADVFEFSLPSDAVVVVGFLSESRSADLKVEILDAGGTLMASGTSFNGAFMNFPLGMTAGTYYAKVTSAGEIDVTHPYIITYKNKDDLSLKSPTPLEMGQTAQSFIYHLQDESVFTFSLSETQPIRIGLSPSGGIGKYRMELTDSTGRIIDTVDALEHGPVYMEGAYRAADYTLRVLPVDAVDAAAAFTISMNPSEKQLESEPNDTAPEATDFHPASSITGRVSDSADVDYFAFDLAVPQYLELTFSSPESEKDFAIDIFKDAVANRIRAIKTQDGEDVSLHMGLNMGRYFIRITPLGEAETIHFYTLSLQNSDRTDLEIESNNTRKFASAIEPDIPISGTISSASDTDYFGFHVPEAASISLDFRPTTTTGDYFIEIMDSSGNVMTQGMSTDGADRSFSADIPAGDFHIEIEPGIGIDPDHPYELEISSTVSLTGLRRMVAIAVSGEGREMALDGAQTLSAAMVYSDATEEPISAPTWTSLNPGVAAVDDSGQVTAAGAGTTAIIATHGDMAGRFDITVGDPPADIIQHRGNLIIGAGGGTDPADPLFASTQYLSDLVYRRFQDRFFNEKDIRYFNPVPFHDLNRDGLDNGIVDDATPTVSEFGSAITEWAPQQNSDGPLYLYLIDHGGIDTFMIAPEEILTAAQLSGFLDTFQSATGRPVVVMIESPKSGSFIDDLSGENRVVITAADEGNAYIQLKGSASFTQFFMDRILAGDSLQQSWESAKTRLSEMGVPFDTMQPRLSGETAAAIVPGGDFPIDPVFPEITETPSDETVRANIVRTVYAVVSDPGIVEAVWAIVLPPYYVPPETTDDLEAPPVNLPTVSLTDPDQDGRFEAAYTDFTYNGEYLFTFYARSKDNTMAISPATVFTVTEGIALTVLTPFMSPDTGIYTTAQTVSLFSGTRDAVIRYTTDGTDPTENSTLYTEPIPVSETTTIKAKAYKSGWIPSHIARETYVITGKVDAPYFAPEPGNYFEPIHVTLSCVTTGTVIRYTMDGSDPTENDPIYTDPIPVLTDMTIKAKAFKTDWEPSEISVGEYTITRVQKGNLNRDEVVDLNDAILGLKVLSGIDTAGQIRENYADSGADVNGNGVIELVEVIYILQRVAGL